MRKRRIAWGICLILCLIMASFKGGAVSYVLLYGLLLYPVVSYVYLILAFLQFRIYQEVDSRTMTVGVPMNYRFTLQNDGWIPISSIRVQLFSEFSTVENIPDDTEFELIPGEDYTYMTRMVCKYRGEYKVGVRKLILTDFLQIFVLPIKLRENLEAIVLPRIPELTELGIEKEQEQILQRENIFLHNEADTVAEDYNIAAGMRYIHWGATARVGSLKSRKSVGEEQAEIRIYFELERRGKKQKEFLPIENKMLETLLCLIREGSEGGQPIFVEFIRTDYQERQDYVDEVRVYNYSEFEDLYAYVQGLVFEEGQCDYEFLESREFETQDLLDRSFYFVLQTMNDEKMEALKRLSDRGAEITVFFVGKELKLPWDEERIRWALIREDGL